MSARTATLRPTRASAALAVVFAVVSIGVLATPAVVSALAVEVIGLVLLAGGLSIRRLGWPVVGTLLSFGAVVALAAAMALVWVDTGDLLSVVQFVPGMLGVVCIALGVVPLRGGGSRRLVKAGTALVFLSIFVTGIVQRPSLTALLGSGVLTVLSWDAGENAFGLGAQLGRAGSTLRVEAVHLLGTGLVGALAVVAGRVATGLSSPGLPMAPFALLVIGLVLLAGALHA